MPPQGMTLSRGGHRLLVGGKALPLASKTLPSACIALHGLA